MAGHDRSHAPARRDHPGAGDAVCRGAAEACGENRAPAAAAGTPKGHRGRQRGRRGQVYDAGAPGAEAPGGPAAVADQAPGIHGRAGGSQERASQLGHGAHEKAERQRNNCQSAGREAPGARGGAEAVPGGQAEPRVRGRRDPRRRGQRQGGRAAAAGRRARDEEERGESPIPQGYHVPPVAAALRTAPGGSQSHRRNLGRPGCLQESAVQDPAAGPRVHAAAGAHL
mmetsp:Transcript_73708/g.210074  ORF Transcript_73708/g.210074 Transcript_73708/m.210074 type:complete len:227 (-) Transcript_73708:1403-2083(-)